MKRALVFLVLGCFTLGVASVALAANDNNAAALNLHITPYVAPSEACDNQPSPTSLTMNNQGGLAPNAHGAWILVCNGSDSLGVAGAQFSLDYNLAQSVGVDLFGWTLCADAQFPDFGDANWFLSGRGNLVTWEATQNCQNLPSEPFVPRSVVAIIGQLYVYAYSPDILALGPRTLDGRAKVADCSFAETDITGLIPPRLGFAEFGLGPGYNPCGLPTPVEETTWGKIKSNFK